MADSAVAVEPLAMETLKLRNGVEMPAVGFGCAFGNWTVQEGFMGFTPEEAWPAITKALDAGLRHFDTAFIYRTHRILGTCLGQRFATGALKRGDVFITTKVFHPMFHTAPHTAFTFPSKTMDLDNPALDIKATAIAHFHQSLDEIGVGYVDLLLMHWPGRPGTPDKAANQRMRKAAWSALEELYDLGLARSIGVSNFTEEHIADLIADGVKHVPMVNQIEVSPHCVYPKIMECCKTHQIIVQAYSPLGSNEGTVLKDPVLQEMASKYGKDVGQLVLRWLYQNGMCVLPRSSSSKRMRSNAQIFDFVISDEDMAKVAELNKGVAQTNANPYDIK